MLDLNRYIVMDYVGGGTLQQLIAERRAQCKAFSETEISTIMLHIMSAVKVMHDVNVIHRDIKPGITKQ